MASNKFTQLSRLRQPRSFHRARSPFQMLVALEDHIKDPSGKEILRSLKDHLVFEKAKLKQAREMVRSFREMVRLKDLHAQDTVRLKDLLVSEMAKHVELLEEHRMMDRLDILRLQGLNNTRGLFETIQEVLAMMTGQSKKKGVPLWEDILTGSQSLRQCVENATKVPASNVPKQAMHIYGIYNVLSSHVHAGKELAELQAASGKILFHREPLSPEQVKTFLCLGKAASINIEEDPSMRPC